MITVLLCLKRKKSFLGLAVLPRSQLPFYVPLACLVLSHKKLICPYLFGIIPWQSNLRSKKLHRTNPGSNFLGGTFSNRYNVRAPIQFRREIQPQHLERQFFPENRPIHFHINTTHVIRMSNVYVSE